ncbi:MAG: hypothetical protein SCALA702_26020 [Melioribacteraceae bacterium]|nr:MAG: hypothetical protein SCALA702_26020 [Melioribacteraceae bacterium]
MSFRFATANDAESSFIFSFQQNSRWMIWYVYDMKKVWIPAFAGMTSDMNLPIHPTINRSVRGGDKKWENKDQISVPPEVDKFHPPKAGKREWQRETETSFLNQDGRKLNLKV